MMYVECMYTNIRPIRQPSFCAMLHPSNHKRAGQSGSETAEYGGRGEDEGGSE